MQTGLPLRFSIHNQSSFGELKTPTYQPHVSLTIKEMIRCFRKSLIKLSLYSISLASYCLPCHAQLSGEVDLGSGSSKSEAAPAPSIKEITVTGMGTTLESAEKQALAAAIRQAVGAYMDSKTIVENEEVIQDRILSISNAFVEKYEVVGQPKKSSDGLIEITILAKVKTNQVVQALKENNLISGEVAGQNLWAEASTKVMNAQDAVAMLEAKIPELIKSVVTITPLTEKGAPKVTKDSNGIEVPSTAPAVVEEDAASGEATLTWYLEMGIDSKYYNETLLPIVSKCLDAIMCVPPKVAQLPLKQNKSDEAGFFRGGSSSGDNFPIPQNRTYLPKPDRVFSRPYEYGIALINSITRNFDSVEFVYYPNYKNQLHTNTEDTFPNNNRILCYLNLKVLSANGEKLAGERVPTWQPFATAGTQISMVGPFTSCSPENTLYIQRPIIQNLTIKVPIALLKEIKKVDISLEPLEPKLKLEPNKR